MKKRSLILSFVLFAFISATAFISCNDDDIDTNQDSTLVDDCNLTPEQQEGLLYMREEEKLARDVYNYLFDKWNLNIFKNIAGAEQRHMDLLLVEVDLCMYDDSVLPDVGVFNNSHIQELYDALTAQGEISLIEALKVGATIEDVDIFDLDEFSSQTDNAVLLDIYDKLTCGSRNHMRAFVGQLVSQGIEYSPQFIGQEQFDGIINGEHEMCGH